MDKDIITSLTKTFKLFKPPDRIGEIIEYEDVEYLIIGIEQVRLTGSKLRVTYTCQNLTVKPSFQPHIVVSNDYTEFYKRVDILEEEKKMLTSFKLGENLIEIGRVFDYEDNYYRWITYTDLEFEHMILKISALAQPIYPTTQTFAREKLINYKKKKIGLSLI